MQAGFRHTSGAWTLQQRGGPRIVDRIELLLDVGLAAARALDRDLGSVDAGLWRLATADPVSGVRDRAQQLLIGRGSLERVLEDSLDDLGAPGVRRLG